MVGQKIMKNALNYAKIKHHKIVALIHLVRGMMNSLLALGIRIQASAINAGQ